MQNKWGQMLRPGMVFAKMAAIGQRSLSDYSSFGEENQALSPGRLSEVNRWAGMSSWFLPSPVFMFHIFSWAHFNQIPSKLVAGSGGGLGLKWRWNVAPDYFQLSKTWSKRSWAICWVLSEPRGVEVWYKFRIFCSVFPPALPDKNNFSNLRGTNIFFFHCSLETRGLNLSIFPSGHIQRDWWSHRAWISPSAKSPASCVLCVTQESRARLEPYPDKAQLRKIWPLKLSFSYRCNFLTYFSSGPELQQDSRWGTTFQQGFVTWKKDNLRLDGHLHSYVPLRIVPK